MKRLAILGVLFAIVCTGCVSEQTKQSARPHRFMPFLCRDAVVRESAERVAVGTTVIVGKDEPGPRQGFGNAEISQAAGILTNYLEKITGSKCSVLSSASAAALTKGPQIFVGTGGNQSELFPELKKADAHGFVITTKGNDLYIVGASGTATKFAVWFFLMNYADLRLALPGDIGEIYPKLDRIEIPRDLYVFNPAPDFLMRIWSGAYGMSQDAWLADNGSTARFEYHHNMWKIYDQAKFGQSHPEYYPVVQGKPKVPAPKVDGAWQPTFSEPAVAQRAIEYANELFTQQPQMKSVSLSVNDGLGYSETDMRRGKLLPDGSLTISDVYYEYVNTVARGIKQRWPDKYVAFLTYNLVTRPPSFVLEDNVTIFLMNEPKTTYAEWNGKVKHIGIYQWLYGLWYVVPNHWPHALQDYLRWTRAHGGTAFKGEAYCAWSQDAPKMWTLANLLWNTDADVNAVLMDYYEHAYGKEAAPAVARYFAQAEKIYERRRTTKEFKFATVRPGEKQFAEATAPDMEIMSNALDEAARLAVGDANKNRVDMVVRCFRWTEYYWKQYAALEQLRTRKVASDSDATALIEAAQSFYDLMPVREKYYKEQIETLPQYCVYSQIPQKVDWAQVDPAFDWKTLDTSMDRGFGAITESKRKKQTSQEVDAFWLEIGKQHPKLKPFADTQRLIALFPNKPLKNLLPNPSFEELPGKPDEVVKEWQPYHNRMVNATISIDTNVVHSGHASVTAKGLTDCSGIIHQVTVKNHARYRFSFWYRNSKETRHGYIAIMRDPPIREVVEPSLEWTKYEKVFTVDQAGGDTVSFYVIPMLRHGGSEKSQMWFDDVSLEMLSPEGVAP